MFVNAFDYAKRNIPCACRLCACPFSGGTKYSFRHIREDLGAIYYDVPKTGSSTIRAKLGISGVDIPSSLLDPEREKKDYFGFAMVRNPYSRMVSNWRMFTTQGFRVQQLRAMTNRDLSGFAEFAKYACLVPNHHWIPQSFFVPHESEIDLIGKLENMNDVLQQLSAHIEGFNPENLVVNATGDVVSRPTDYYRKFYDNQTYELITKYYSEDLERFDYCF